MEKYGPLFGMAILAAIVVYARYLQTRQEAEMKWLELVEKLAPTVLALVPGIPPALIPVIVEAIGIAENSGKSGQQKLVTAVNHVCTADNTVVVPVVADAITAVVQATNATAKATGA